MTEQSLVEKLNRVNEVIDELLLENQELKNQLAERNQLINEAIESLEQKEEEL